MNRKNWQRIYHAKVNVNFIVENVIQIRSGIMVNVDVSVKNIICEKDYIWNHATCSCKNGKYLENILDNSVITCDEIIDAEAKSYHEEAKTIPRYFNEKKVACKKQSFYILLVFLSIIIALLLAVSIYCYLIKYWAKQKHLLPFNATNNELKKIMY